MEGFDHRKIEKKWSAVWKKAELYKTEDAVKDKKNFYLLTEFPYPSGNLHVGHWYAFALPDILARYMRMKGRNVLFPMGFDAFGLPAENAAIKNKLNPRTWTQKNIEYMRGQIDSMGASFDWSREVQTIDPAYYKWTQWQFLQLFNKGLVYRKNTTVNWCPKDKTVLANEQVTDGKCERCDSVVEQKMMLQWNIKISEYADRLIDDLEPLDWPEEIKQSQRNWIGRSEGAEIDFPLDIGLKYKYVILHGFESNPDKPKWQWIKRELEKMGHEVIVPALPNTNNPSEDEQVEAALKATQYDENTVLCGHSLGSVVAMKVVEKLKSPIGRLVLVAGFADPEFKDHSRNFEKRFVWKFDAAKIRSNAKVIQILHDPRDTAVSETQVSNLEKLLGVAAVRGTSNEPHFTGDTEPDVLMWLRATIRVFTTRPDTLFGATYLVLAPDHPWIKKAMEHKGLFTNEKEIERYISLTNKKSELERQTDQKEKTGVKLEGVTAIHPATGTEIPLYVADYVLATYGTGAIMAVPAHDERDYEFAKKFSLPIKKVVSGAPEGELFEGAGTLSNSGEFDGMTSEQAQSKITEKFGRKKTTYKLRDWIVSRQRYWGVPIPIIHCDACGAQPVSEEDLPVELPDVEDYLPTGDGKSPLAKVDIFTNVPCPKCGGEGKRETDTLDTFVDSSWYFLRYTDPKNRKEFAELSRQKNWMPVDLYSGGAEHTTMHLLYSRFWHKALHDMGLVSDPEPYRKRMNRSLIMGPDGQKMSKSRGNVIDPDEVVDRLGADTVRMYLAFIGPYNEVSNYPWNPDGVVGVRRFLERVFRLKDLVQAGDDISGLIVPLHRTIKKVGEDIEILKFNTAISALMIFLNEAEKNKKIGQRQWETFLKILEPFAPFVAEELWSLSGKKTSLLTEAWPVYSDELLHELMMTIVIQVNGKTRGEVSVPTDSDKKAQEDAARFAMASRIADKKVLKTIVVPGRLVNFVLEE